jgi:hypothetical protein
MKYSRHLQYNRVYFIFFVYASAGNEPLIDNNVFSYREHFGGVASLVYNNLAD